MSELLYRCDLNDGLYGHVDIDDFHLILTISSNSQRDLRPMSISKESYYDLLMLYLPELDVRYHESYIYEMWLYESEDHFKLQSNRFRDKISLMNRINYLFS